MPLLSEIARRRKLSYFLQFVGKDDQLLEIGSGSGWVQQYLRDNGWKHYTGVDLHPPADLVGDIRDWSNLGLKPESFDRIIAFEVVEHIDCFQECFDLLRPNGLLLVTTPIPHRDWVMKLLEAVGLNQKRTSPHDNLVYLQSVPHFKMKEFKIIGGLSQWAVLEKPQTAPVTAPERAFKAAAG
ncbi:MAG: class I SAM-dependent methyltransferase [Bryobacterales bacterium]|nr:class I SAM-dependent methyltransferase [Bryobacterales bacterium]